MEFRGQTKIMCERRLLAVRRPLNRVCEGPLPGDQQSLGAEQQRAVKYLKRVFAG